MTPTVHRITMPNTLAGKGQHEIVFYDWGDAMAANVVVCVHGLTRNARDFDLLAQELASRGRRVLCISMAGRGESQWLENTADYHYFSYAADCLRILNNFHLRQVDWVGTSMGGIIGMMIASQHEGRIRKMVLNDIGTLLKREALERIYNYVLSIPPSFPDRAAAEVYLRQVFAPFGIADTPAWPAFVDSSLLPAEGGVKLAVDPRIIEPMRADTQDFTQINDVNIAELWIKIHIPTLILRGELSDILDVETVNAMRATNPRGQTVTIKGVGHAPSLTTPEQISLVANWLMQPPGTFVGI